MILTLEYTTPGHKGFKAGNPGKPKGALSPKTKAWEELGEFICHAGAERYMNALTALEDDKFLEKYAYILEFFKPKLARTDSVQATVDLNQMDVEKAREITDSYLKSKKADNA